MASIVFYISVCSVETGLEKTKLNLRFTLVLLSRLPGKMTDWDSFMLEHTTFLLVSLKQGEVMLFSVTLLSVMSCSNHNILSSLQW